MYNPLYTPRFAVLLEAYLKGQCLQDLRAKSLCRDASKRLESRYVVCIETNTATPTLDYIQVEEQGGGDSSKMQIALQDLLQANNIPEK